MWKLTHGMFDYETSMTEKLPGIPDPTPIEATKPTSPRTSILSNGIRIISQDMNGPITSVALFVGAGSRHENPYTSGSSFFLERLAFKGSVDRYKFRMTRDMERTGSVFNAASARETIAYASEGLRSNVDSIISIIGEVGKDPICNLPEPGSPKWDTYMDEIKLQRDIVKSDLDVFNKDPNHLITEAIHGVAYHGNTLGKLLLLLLLSFLFVINKYRGGEYSTCQLF